jgi:Rrf2 family protein
MLSKTCGYAIRALVYLALKQSENRKVGIQELAQALGVPQHFLGKIMQGLVRRDIVNSTKGPNGGFFANDHTAITPLMDVVDAIDGPGLFRRCFLGLPECSGANPCPLHNHVVDYRNSLSETLKTLTVRDMMVEVEEGLSMLNRVHT